MVMVMAMDTGVVMVMVMGVYPCIRESRLIAVSIDIESRYRLWHSDKE